MKVTNLNSAVVRQHASVRPPVGNGAEATASDASKAEKQLRSRSESVSVELSAAARLQLAHAEAQSVSATTKEESPAKVVASIRKAAGISIRAFNAQNASAFSEHSASATQGLLADNSRAQATESGLLRAVGNDEAIELDLESIGIVRESEGRLALDAKKFDAALKTAPENVRNIVANLAQQANQSAPREPAADGKPPATEAASDANARNSEDRQAELQARINTAQQANDAQRTAPVAGVVNGAAAYERIFSA